MSATYDIRVDPVRSLVTITLAGFFESADLTAFMRDWTAAMAGLSCGPNQHLTLCDVRDLKLQSQAMLAGFDALLARPESQARRLAFVTGGGAIRMQVRRVIAHREAAAFDTLAPALAWLAGGDSALTDAA